MNTKFTQVAGVVVLLLLAPLAPTSALARPFQGSFTVAFAAMPNTDEVGFCGGPTGAAALDFVVEVHGVGTSTLGSLSMTIEKTLDATGPMIGCVTLVAPNGDTLSGTYNGTEPAPDSFGFQVGTGTLTFTGGTGRFQDASGVVNFTATFSSIEIGSYLLDGTVLLHK